MMVAGQAQELHLELSRNRREHRRASGRSRCSNCSEHLLETGRFVGVFAFRRPLLSSFRS